MGTHEEADFGAGWIFGHKLETRRSGFLLCSFIRPHPA
jgi:hypothetical protein